jgi:hypothetical protein
VSAWNYTPVGPFTVQWNSDQGRTDQLIVETWPTIEAAVLRFFEIGLPKRRGWTGQIVDVNERAVLVWSVMWATLERCGPEGSWFGCDVVFRIMDAFDIANPVDRAVWEHLAEETTTGWQ